MRKKIVRVIAGLLSAVAVAGAFVGCSASTAKTELTIAVPNDPTNEARALLLLEKNGYIKLKEGAGITATVKDIAENPYNLKFQEVQAATIPSVLKDVDYAIINSNYAIGADLSPVNDSLLLEDSASNYVNILTVHEDNKDADLTKALAAALQSQKVADYITNTYEGAVISVANPLTDGFDADVDYDALKGTEVSVAASPTPHAEVLKVAADILKEKEITLNVIEFDDYVQPNLVVESGEVYANYFQHVPYLDDFNAENGTHLVSAAGIHVEPMGLYGGKQTTLDAIKK